jgi:ubiquinone/menaquinone biosynthesis C-methylase UbiE
METPSPVQRAAATYDAASDAYDHPANGFWARFGRETVSRIGLAAGDRVLDVCCGSGASAIPAAETVGPLGRVVAVDVSARLLALARQKAHGAHLQNLQFVCSDLMLLEPSLGTFDAVVCVFGIFFLPEVPAALAHLWSFVKTGGRMAITTWGPDFFEPASSIFWESIRAERADLYRGFNPWDKLTTPQALADVFDAAGIPHPAIQPVASTHPIPTPEHWWMAVMGSGYRGTLEHLTPEQFKRVRDRNIAEVGKAKLAEVEANVIYAVAQKE